MRNSIIMALCGLLFTTFSFGQKTVVSDLLNNLSKIKDQYSNYFDPSEVDEKITLIIVEGTNTAFQEVYSKFKGKKLVDNTRIVAGWKDVMPGGDYKSKFSHMSDGFKSNEGLGKDGYSVLFDINSETHQNLNLKKYSIVTVDKKENRVDIQDFGSDRIEFIKAIRQFFI